MSNNTWGQQPLDGNPFADPSSSHNANPFANPNDSAFSLGSEPSGGINNIAAYAADHDRRARELEQKQRELEQREAQLSQREQELDQYKPNWPPFIPIIVHDIKLVPAEHQHKASLTYYYWLSLASALVFNLVFNLVRFSVTGLITSLIFLIFIGLLSFVLWYYPIYTGWRRLNKRGAAILFYTFFIFFACHIVFALYMALGIPGTGSGGLINTIKDFIGHHWAAAVVGLISSIFWLFQLIGGLVIFRLIWNFKRNNADINFANAKTEFNGLTTIFKLFRAGSS